MIDIKEWTISAPRFKCDQCGGNFRYISRWEHHETNSIVCSSRCAELFTADYNAGEAEQRGKQNETE